MRTVTVGVKTRAQLLTQFREPDVYITKKFYISNLNSE